MSLKSIVSKLIRGEKVSRIHGHELVIREENKILDNLAFVEGDKVIIEIGSQREAGSTLYFSNLAFNNSMSFVTVDLNPETTAAAKKIVKSKSSLFEAVNDYGEKYLDKFKGRIALLYLDAFDIDGDWHSNDLRAWYKNKGSELNDENCWRMHLDCAVAVVNKIVPGGYIVFDDAHMPSVQKVIAHALKNRAYVQIDNGLNNQRVVTLQKQRSDNRRWDYHVDF